MRSKEDMTDINGELFKKDVQDKLKSKMGLSMNEASSKILHRGNSYIVQTCDSNRIGLSEFETLCVVLGLDEDKYKGGKKEKEKPQITNDVVVGLTSIYNKENAILAEIKTQQILTRELININKQTLEIMKQMSGLLNTNTEKVKAIFTEVKYNK